MWGLVPLVAGILWRPAAPPADPWTVVVGGDSQGYLTPCGCVDPMSGGIRRRATAYRALRVPDRTVILENAALVAGMDRQSELKAETLAQAMELMQVDAVNLGAGDGRLGVGTLGTIARLTKDRVVATGLVESERLSLPPWRAVGPFLVGGVSTQGKALAQNLGEASLLLDESVQRLADEAEGTRRQPILLLDGDEADARALAGRFPTLRLIVYRSSAQATDQAHEIGATWLVSPGPQGKRFLTLSWTGDRFTRLLAVDLGPSVQDDPAVARIYAAYQRRVRDEALLDRRPRTAGAKFAGSLACRSCHAADYDVWAKSEHAGALKTLEDDGQDRDPDCTGCHVTGLDSTDGFQTRSLTPDLANVGCESCHGPSADHAAQPATKTPQDAMASCRSCHNAEHSPSFEATPYWHRIRHGQAAPKPQ